MKRPYTVILIYPEDVATYYGDTYQDVVYAENKNEAAMVARDRAIEEWDSCRTIGKEHIELARNNLPLIAIFDGNLLGASMLRQLYRPAKKASKLN